MEYPSNLNELISWGAAGIMFIFYKRPNSTSSARDGDLGFSTIAMPVPKNLENPMDISWEQSELGAVGARAAGITTEIDGGGAAANILQSLGSNAINVATLGAIDQAKAKAITGLRTRKIANPYIAMTFKSIGFRKFKMEFKFTPHNIDECETIDLIVKKFRKTALPSGSKTAARIGYPGEIDIFYIGRSKQWLPQFKKAVIESVQVSYSGQGHFATMDNGFPAETVLNLEFTENELVWREDIHAGGASY